MVTIRHFLTNENLKCSRIFARKKVQNAPICLGIAMRSADCLNPQHADERRRLAISRQADLATCCELGQLAARSLSGTRGVTRPTNFASFLEARARLVAGIFMDRLVIHAHDALRAVAPEVARRDVFAVLVGKGLLRRGAGKHFLGAKMLAKGLAHAVPFSLSSVRRMRACAIGTL
jgi:hypothetical protein